MATETKPNAVHRFAHLIGLGAPAAVVTAPVAAKPKAEGDDKKRDDESDDEFAARMEAEDEADQKDKEDKDAKAAKVKAEEGDDDSDEADQKDDKTKNARSRERARCATIFASPAAANNIALACELAFGKSAMSRSAAVSTLEVGASVPAPKASSLDKRMAAVVVPVVGAGPVAGKPAPDTAAGLAATITAAGYKAAGRTFAA